ncbi:hypothetical protein KKC1_26190 [Calderihabitans maritimus]|uniref:Uncharacterized protein n=1 Tax=Calderihabitans maritimus TaxID=1246530 RepID=A0A1Z5HVX4_9FIRM|nr:hypothetical protein KKC1_26190 [Calderihabitans maritimus]
MKKIEFENLWPEICCFFPIYERFPGRRRPGP